MISNGVPFAAKETEHRKSFFLHICSTIVDFTRWLHGYTILFFSGQEAILMKATIAGFAVIAMVTSIVVLVKRKVFFGL